MKRYLVLHSLLNADDVFGSWNSNGDRCTLADAREMMKNWPRTEAEAEAEARFARNGDHDPYGPLPNGYSACQWTEHEVRDALNAYQRR